MDREDEAATMGRAIIDSRAPFKSVKQAVLLFGERVLAPQIYANQLQQIKADETETGHETLKQELQNAKQSLEKAKEENNSMAYRIKSLQDELERTKNELRKLKTRAFQNRKILDPEAEDLKFIENATKLVSKSHNEANEFQKKRFVKFASPASLAQVIISKDETLFERPCLDKKKKKRTSIVPLVGWCLSKHRENEKDDSPKGY